MGGDVPAPDENAPDGLTIGGIAAPLLDRLREAQEAQRAAGRDNPVPDDLPNVTPYARPRDGLAALWSPAPTEQQRREIGFASHIFASCALPYRDPGDLPVWERSNGSLTLRVKPGEWVDRQGRVHDAYPYGVVPRLALTWLATEIQRTHERQVQLGKSLYEFLARLGLADGGKQRVAVRRGLVTLFTARVTIHDTRAERPGDSGRGFMVGDQWNLWWDDHSQHQQTLIPSYVEVSEQFFRSVIDHGFPVELAALRTLNGSPLRLDLYMWLTWRMARLPRSTTVPWDALALQFGGQYAQLRQFKANFIKQLGAVCAVYEDARVEPTDAGLILRPSPTHVAKRRRRRQLDDRLRDGIASRFDV